MTGEPITRKQLADQLMRCSRYDGRTLDAQTFEDWYELLGDLPYEDVKGAVTAWYRTDRRWIMPRDIVEHHEKLATGRAVEAARQNPPGCGCGVAYVLSAREGSRIALPDSEHASSCRYISGVLVFDRDRDRGTWAVMPLDPASFNEEQWEWLQAETARRWGEHRPAIDDGEGLTAISGHLVHGGGGE